MDIGTHDRAATLRRDPLCERVDQIRAALHDLGIQLRYDLDTSSHPPLRALAQTTADLLDALEQAFADAEAHGASGGNDVHLT